MSDVIKFENLRVHELRIENFLRIRTATIRAMGRHVIISAKNGTGKTSALDSIWVCTMGPDSRNMPEPIHHGEDKATITLDLGEVIAQRTFTKGGTKFSLTAADGSKFKNPGQILEGFMAKYALQPHTFLEKRPQDQLDDYLMVAGVTHPFEEVEQITGEKFPLQTPTESCYAWMTRISGDDTSIFYNRRRDKGRQWDDAKGAVTKQEEYLKTIPVPEEQGDVTDLMAEEDLLNKRQLKRTEAVTAYDKAKTNRTTAETAVTNATKAKTEAQKKIDDLKKQLQDAEAAFRTAETKLVIADDDLLTCKAIETDTLNEMNLTPDLTEPISLIRARIKQASTGQEAAIKRKTAEDRLTELRMEAEKHETDHKNLETKLNKLRALRKRILQGIDLGIPEISVGEGKLLYKQVDFKQASLAQGLRVACAIVMRQNPSLKLLRIDNAEHLDDESTQLILDMADKEGWQVIMTKVDSRNDNLNLEFVEAGEGD